MLEKIKYINHMNETLDFGREKLFVNENDLRDFAWSISSKNNKISGFKKGIVSKTIPVVIICDSEEEGIRIRNNLFECAEKDVLKMQYGKIIIGDYHMKCYITGSKKSDYLISKRHMMVSLTISTDLPSWIKERTTIFGHGKGTEGKNLDLNNDFPYDYTSNLLGKSLNNTGFVESNFKMTIYGVCENPEVVIAGHSYQVNVSIAQNEYLTIDSIEKTIVLTHEDGTTENCFNLRNKGSYVFEKIPSGISGVSSGYFRFDVTLLEERSEPKWT